jgi:serine/threonine protein kinase
VKILDLGLAKSTGELSAAVYMSPEQARGRRVDKYTEVWAFGVVLYEILSGKRLLKARISRRSWRPW